MKKNTVKAEIINTTSEAIENTKTAAELTAELNEKVTDLTATEANKLINAINEKLKEENTAAKNVRIESLISMERTAFFKEFIAHPCYTAMRLKLTKDGNYELVDGEKQLNFKTVDDAYIKAGKGKTLANSLRYYGMTALFVHNLARNMAGELSEEKHIVSVPKFNGEAVEEYDFSACSMVALEKQLNTIIETILPEEIRPKMLKADVKAIRFACVQDKMLAFTIQNEVRIMNKIFNAIAIRTAGANYTLDSKAKCHKEKKSEKKSA